MGLEPGLGFSHIIWCLSLRSILSRRSWNWFGLATYPFSSSTTNHQRKKKASPKNKRSRCGIHHAFKMTSFDRHESIDCFSLPDTSFQSHFLRAIPWPCFVIYILTIVQSHEGVFSSIQPPETKWFFSPIQMLHTHTQLPIKASVRCTRCRYNLTATQGRRLA